MGSVWRTVLGFPGAVAWRVSIGGSAGRTQWAHRDRAALPRGMDAVYSRRQLFNKTKDLQGCQGAVSLFFRVPSRGILFQQRNQLEQSLWGRGEPQRRQIPFALFFRVPHWSILF